MNSRVSWVQRPGPCREPPALACKQDSRLPFATGTVRAFMDHEERWLPARGYAGFYEVSDLGRVYSMPRAATAGGLLAVQLNSRGYRIVILCKYGRPRTVTVARLVLEAFDGPARGRRARHGPEGKADDSLDNLSWSL